ncbi:DUF3344 domain-containing protein [Streptomyces sp. NPDC017979]|uniref:DUF3344 domain-containing protein n=1 Tax=Streptomyces sp. NPDC017979 TaxID=3365024 RepID=UPI00378E855C
MSNSPGFTTKDAPGDVHTYRRPFLAPLPALPFLSVLSFLLLLSAAPAVGAAVADVEESPRIPFAQRYHAVQHGGIARAANSAITCRTRHTAKAADCAAVKQGGRGVNSDYEMFYVDEDDDPNTYNSSRAHLALPANSRVTYARLYWGGNLRVGEQKPPKDNGRVLIAEPGGRYKEVLADTRTAHRDAAGADAFQASADITPLVRDSRAGLWTVAQVNVAMGHSKVGAWGGWTLVVAYENSAEPLRQLALWDGFEALDATRARQDVKLGGLRIPARAKGTAGFVAYDGDRGVTGDALNVRTNSGKDHSVHDATNPAADVMNSTISNPGPAVQRQPAHLNTLGYESDVVDISSALVSGGTSLSFRFTTESDDNPGYFLGVLFVQADTRR